MPYIVRRGTVDDGQHVYQTGDVIEAKKGSLDDLEPGVVEWVPAAKAKAAEAAEPEPESEPEGSDG